MHGTPASYTYLIVIDWDRLVYVVANCLTLLVDKLFFLYGLFLYSLCFCLEVCLLF